MVALTTGGYYISYLMATALLLYRRLDGSIKVRNTDDPLEEPVNNVGRRLVWGPWRIPGVIGIAVNAFSVMYLTVALFWSFWPSVLPVTAANMNYNVLLIGAVVLIAVVYYLVRGKKEYTGPVVEVNYTT